MEKIRICEFSTKNNFCPILLVLPFKKMSLQTELTSPACFRIQGGGYPECDRRRSTEILVSNIGWITNSGGVKKIFSLLLFHPESCQKPHNWSEAASVSCQAACTWRLVIDQVFGIYSWSTINRDKELVGFGQKKNYRILNLYRRFFYTYLTPDFLFATLFWE